MRLAHIVPCNDLLGEPRRRDPRGTWPPGRSVRFTGVVSEHPVTVARLTPSVAATVLADSPEACIRCARAAFELSGPAVVLSGCGQCRC
jgi:hypothetical protein